MENTIANAEVVDNDRISTNEVGVGSTIEIKRTDRDKIEKVKLSVQQKQIRLKEKFQMIHLLAKQL